MSRSTSESLPFGSTDKLTGLAWGTLLVLCGALFLDALDVSMMGVALPSIRTDLHMSTSSLQWVVSAYVLGYGGFLLLGGRAADLLGSRRVFLIALGIFVVASMLGGFANDGTLSDRHALHQGRERGVHGARRPVDHHDDLRRGPARNKALSIFTATGATGFSLGLVFGGLLTEIGWRWVFFLPAPVALITLVAGLRLVPADRGVRRPSGAFDIAGAVSMRGGGRCYCSVFARVRGAERRLALGPNARSLVGVEAILAAFVARELACRRATRGPASASSARARSCAPTSVRCRCSAAGSGSSSSSPSTCSSCAAGRRSTPGSRSSPRGFSSPALPRSMAQLVTRFGVMRLIVAE